MYRRMRSLLCVLAVAGLAAACQDNPAGPGPEEASQGRMLRPEQVLELRGNDFIVIRPEQYAQYGITAPEPRLLPVARAFLPQEPCFLQNNLRSDVNYLNACYEEPTPVCCTTITPTPTGPAALFSYGSNAIYDGWVQTGPVLLKQLRLSSFSTASLNVASFTLKAQYQNVGAASGSGCSNVPYNFDSDTYTGQNSGTLSSNRTVQWTGTIRWRVNGTHTFTPIPGATGGGTFTSTKGYCG